MFCTFIYMYTQTEFCTSVQSVAMLMLQIARHTHMQTHPHIQTLTLHTQIIVAGQQEGNCLVDFCCRKICFLSKNCHPKMQNLVLKIPTLKNLGTKTKL